MPFYPTVVGFCSVGYRLYSQIHYAWHTTTAHNESPAWRPSCRAKQQCSERQSPRARISTRRTCGSLSTMICRATSLHTRRRADEWGSTAPSRDMCSSHRVPTLSPNDEDDNSPSTRFYQKCSQSGRHACAGDTSTTLDVSIMKHQGPERGLWGWMGRPWEQWRSGGGRNELLPAASHGVLTIFGRPFNRWKFILLIGT